MVFDDVQLPQVESLIETFIQPDPRWEALAATGKWKAFRRASEGPLAEGEWNQPFFPKPSPGLVRRAKDLVPVEIKRWLRHP